MIHKIAIIRGDAIYNSYDDYTRVVTSISDWAEVSSEDLKLLQRAQSRKNFTVIEQQPDQDDFIARTVAEEIENAKNAEATIAAEKARKAALVDARRYKKDLKDKESKIALLKKLQAELGNEVT